MQDGLQIAGFTPMPNLIAGPLIDGKLLAEQIAA